MYVDGDKIKAIIGYYGRTKGYEEKSFVARFCEDFDVNYNQWNAYTRGKQNVGTKIIQFLMEKFPRLNLNWLLKDGYNMWLNETEETNAVVVEEPRKNVTLELIYEKLERIHEELKG